MQNNLRSWAFLGLAALACALLCVAPARGETILVMGTGLPGGNYHLFGRLLAQVVNQNTAQTGIRLKPRPTDGSVSNLKGLGEGWLQLGLSQADTAYMAYRGEGPWQKLGPQKDLRTVYKIYTEAVTCVARSGAGIKTGNDLRGKRVALGTEGSGTHGNAVQALSLCWLKPADLSEALLINAPEAMRLMYQNKLDAFFYTVGHPNHTLAKFIKYYGQARLVSFKATGGMIKKFPYYVNYFIWKSDYPGLQNQGDKVDTFGIRSFIMSSDKVPAKAIYEITRIYLANLDYFKEQLKPMRELDPPTAQSAQDLTWNVSAPYHKGVDKLFKETDIW